ncbi:DNA adenine methylase [Psittacicella hinzii]|uniref:Site-specific DNA-methyltransferase (adenine-specific) n=1 Tax=Psittacicella hinzii TaxID=2028575 RepID=A0A3A1Y136_9GAMM|nr:Dam family site-specific DNA-(adenine-N6)-methyltransferase [Psittacicella hinzii]RIY31150.1 DNA adenine methylase [Psittacicella hinzii]
MKGRTKKIKAKPVRSPLFYVGDKYKLMPELLTLFPPQINTFYDVFCGGGSASLNVTARKFILNDLNDKVMSLHRHLHAQAPQMSEFIAHMHQLINSYGLSLSEIGTNEQITALKKEFVKTYFSRYNQTAYLKLREDYNAQKENMDLLYLLLVYGFNHMIRFNKQGDFNLPVGNVDWNKNVTTALNHYANWAVNNDIVFSPSLDFAEFIQQQEFSSGDFLYFDPPYLITFSDYNKLWSEEDELRLYALLDQLDANGIKWGLSNMLAHKQKENKFLASWAQKYKTFRIKSNYISRFDNTIKQDSIEIYVTNC